MPDRRPFQVPVECYAGYRGEQTPLRFRIEDRSVEIDEILDQWLAPEHRYFKCGAPTAVPGSCVTT